MNSKCLRVALLALIVGTIGADGSPAEAPTDIAVTVAAGADAAYAARANRRKGHEQSYVFGQGSFFPGSGSDPAMAEVSFTTIAHQLALGLADQGFMPTKDAASADLLITVHWGETKRVVRDNFMADSVTSEVENYLANPSADPLLQDYGRLEQLSSMHDAVSSAMEQGLLENARLLGYARALKAEQERQRAQGRPEAPSLLQNDLMQERYFVIVAAWDNRLLRRKKPERKLLWITHVSTLAAGHRFLDALPALAGAGGRYFGHDSKQLQTVRVQFRSAASPDGSARRER